MPFTPEQNERILNALSTRLLDQMSCPLCGHDNWTIQPAGVFFTLQDDLRKIRLAGKGLPCVPIVCQHCGNTHFLNMLTLGLGDMIEPLEPAAEE